MAASGGKGRIVATKEDISKRRGTKKSSRGTSVKRGIRAVNVR